MTAPTIGAVGLGSSLAGGILSAFGQKQSAEAQSRMYAYQSQVAQINSQIDKQNADYARMVGERQELNYGLKEGQIEGQIRARQGASGLDVNSGSAVDIQRSQRQIGQMDLATIRDNAAKTAYDYSVKSTQDINQAGLYGMASANAQRAGNINVAASLIGTAGGVSSRWLQGNTIGLFSGSGDSSYGGGMGVGLGATGGLY